MRRFRLFFSIKTALLSLIWAGSIFAAERNLCGQFYFYAFSQSEIVKEIDNSVSGRPAIEIERKRITKFQTEKVNLQNEGLEPKSDELVLGFHIGTDPGYKGTGHAFVLTKEQRLDGGIFTRTKLRRPNTVERNTVLIRFSKFTESQMQLINQNIRNIGSDFFRRYSISCASAACNAANVPGAFQLKGGKHLFLEGFLFSLLENDNGSNPYHKKIQIIGNHDLNYFLSVMRDTDISEFNESAQNVTWAIKASIGGASVLAGILSLPYLFQ